MEPYIILTYVMRSLVFMTALWAALLWQNELRRATNPRLKGVARTKLYFTLHVLVFVIVTILWSDYNQFRDIFDHRFLNIWSNTIRLHALLCIIMSAIIKRYGINQQKG
jgi:hypothetical protein